MSEATLEDTSERVLPVSLLAEYLFCARTLYWRMVAPVRVPRDAALVRGAQAHEQVRAAGDARALARFGLHDWRARWEVSLTAGAWTGRVDLLLESPHSGELLPVECKSRRSPGAPPAAALQLGVYMKLLEQTRGVTVSRGMIWYLEEDELEEVPHHDALRRRVHTIEAHMLTWLAAPTLPDVSAQAHGVERVELCELCPYDMFCYDQQRPLEPDDPMRRLIRHTRASRGATPCALSRLYGPGLTPRAQLIIDDPSVYRGPSQRAGSSDE